MHQFNKCKITHLKSMSVVIINPNDDNNFTWRIVYLSKQAVSEEVTQFYFN